jgi:hypothetical protein
MYATLILMPGITTEFLQSVIDAERVFVVYGDSGSDGYLYCLERRKTCFQLILALLSNVHGASTDHSHSFVVSQEVDNLSRHIGTLTGPLPNENSKASEMEQALKVVSDDMANWKPVEDAMFSAGKAVRRYLAGRPIPTNNHLECAVWATQLRGQIPRDDFRVVCDNLRRGWSAIGDC